MLNGKSGMNATGDKNNGFDQLLDALQHIKHENA